jgi:hypothetical protein
MGDLPGSPNMTTNLWGPVFFQRDLPFQNARFDELLINGLEQGQRLCTVILLEVSVQNKKTPK